MPRNGDGSSDNGPIEGHEIVHGAGGDKSLKHTKHVAPMPELEQGDALPGLGAGGVAAPIADNAEEFGTNEPRKDPLADPEDADTAATRNMTSPEPRPSNKRQKTAEMDVSQGKDTSGSATNSSPSQRQNGADKSDKESGSKSNGPVETHELDKVMREKAEKYVNLNEDEVNMASAGTEEGKREARADRRADAVGESKSAGTGHEEAKKHGGHADVEEMHGSTKKTSSESHSGGSSSGKSGTGANSSSSSSSHHHNKDTDKAGNDGHEKGHAGHVNELEQVQRKQAEKFGINLQNE